MKGRKRAIQLTLIQIADLIPFLESNKLIFQAYVSVIQVSIMVKMSLFKRLSKALAKKRKLKRWLSYRSIHFCRWDWLCVLVQLQLHLNVSNEIPTYKHIYNRACHLCSSFQLHKSLHRYVSSKTRKDSALLSESVKKQVGNNTYLSNNVRYFGAGLSASFYRKTGNKECDCALTLCPNSHPDINKVDGIHPISV